MPTIDDVIQQVTGLTDVDAGMDIVLQQIIDQDTDLKKRLDAAIAGNDPAKLQQVSDALGKAISDRTRQKQAVIDAVTLNTPA